MRTAERQPSPRTARAARHHFAGRKSDPDPVEMVCLNGDCVRDTAGRELGRVEGVVMDDRGDRVRYAILSLGASAGWSAKLYAVPWSMLSVNAENACVVLCIPTERIEAAPSFDRDTWSSIADPGWREKVDAYYGKRASW